MQDMTEVANALSVAQLGRLLVCLKLVHGENFSAICLLLVRNGSLRTIGTTVDFLLGHDQGETLQVSLQQWLRDNSLRATLLEWVLRNRYQQKYGPVVEPLITPALFRAILITIDQESLKRSGNRKISLAEVVADDGELIREVTEGQPLGMVRDLANLVLLNQGFDPLTKRSIVARFIRCFPSLQKLLDGGAPAGEGKGADGMLKVSQASLDSVRREYEILVHEKIPANKEAVEIAREQGDLRENSEYKMARQDQDMLLARKAQIEKDLVRAQVVDFSSATEDVVSIGSVVTLVDGKGKMEKFAILGAWDGHPERRILSYQTPLGRALLGKKVGESLAIEGQSPRSIGTIARWVDVEKTW
jgi:transcription elongation GreA/GreB family factor